MGSKISHKDAKALRNGDRRPRRDRQGRLALWGVRENRQGMETAVPGGIGREGWRYEALWGVKSHTKTLRH